MAFHLEPFIIALQIIQLGNIINKEEITSMSNTYEISHQLYKWLVSYQVLPNNLKYKPSGNFQIDSRLAQQLQSGYLISKLVLQLAAQQSVMVNQPLLSSIKNSNTPAARVYNWNILIDTFQKLDIVLQKQVQKQITSGKFESLIKFLIEINMKGKSKNSKITKEPENNDAVDLKHIRKYEDIKESQSVLQTIIILISQAFSLTHKQSIATLSDSSKYLSHLIVKGIKGSFQQVMVFINDAQDKLAEIMYLTEKDSPQKNLEMLLQIFKPTLISRDAEVAKAGCSLLEQINYESLKYNGKNIIYQILCKENEGFDFIYMGLKRHPYLNYQIFQFLFPLIENSFKDFFSTQFQRTINNEQQYIISILLFLPPIFDNQFAKEALWKSGMIQLWEAKFEAAKSGKHKGKQSFTINEETKILYTELIYQILLNYYQKFQEGEFESQLAALVEGFKKSTRSQIFSIKIPSLYKLFNLLEFLAEQKNKLAALLYKKLIFLFVQNHEDSEIREIIVENFIITLKQFPTIPLEFLIDPFLKQLSSTEGTTYILNIYDFKLMMELCKHPKMTEERALSFLEYFIQLYTKSIIYSPITLHLIEAVIDRFGQSQAIRQQCLLCTHKNLSIYSMLTLGKNKGNLNKRSSPGPTSKEQKIINNQKKSQIIEVIKRFVKIEHRQLTEKIKEKVLEIYLDWYQNRGIQDRGLESILMEIGDVDEMLVNYSAQKHERQHQRESELSYRRTEKTENEQHKNLKSYENSPIKGYNHVFHTENDEGNRKLKELGIGYKKKKSSLNKYDVLLSNKSVKPDPRVLEDIQKIKQKWKLEYSRSKIIQEEAKKQKGYKLNQKQLLQRNLSLGYAKLPVLDSGKMLFEYNSVKKTHLKDTFEPIDLEFEEERQKNSVDNILQRYHKHIKTIFKTYSKKSGYISNNKNSNIEVLSFTEIMKLLRDKQLLGKTPKIVINEIITSINQKRKKQQNVLGGIYEEDFSTFLIYLTDIYMKYNTEGTNRHLTDEPFGIKLEKFILKIIQNEPGINNREFFDPKIQKLKEDLQYNEEVKIPEGFKKIFEKQIQLNHTIKKFEKFRVQEKYATAYQILNGIIYEALGINIIAPYTEINQKPTIVPSIKIKHIQLHPQMTQKHLKNSERIVTEDANDKSEQEKNQFKVSTPAQKKKSVNIHYRNLREPRSQSHRNVSSVIGIHQMGEEEQKKWVEKEKKRQEHAKKLKQDLEKLKEEKQKKQMQEKEKQKLQIARKKKKQQLKKLYLEENKKKIQESKHKQEEQQKLKEEIQKQKKEKRKVQLKQKGAQLLQKQRKVIQQKLQKVTEKKKNQEFIKNKKEALMMGKSASGNNLNVQKALQEKKREAQEEKLKELLIKNSVQSGQLKEIADKYSKQFNELFEAYWIWNKQKMDLKSFAQIMKDFDISQQYASPSLIAQTFKNVAKGSLLTYNGFIESIAKLAYKSEEIGNKIKEEERVKDEDKDGEKKEEQKLDPSRFNYMIKSLLRMDDKNYKQVVLKIKLNE